MDLYAVLFIVDIKAKGALPFGKTPLILGLKTYQVLIMEIEVLVKSLPQPIE